MNLLSGGTSMAAQQGDVRRDSNAIPTMPGLAQMLNDPRMIEGLRQLQEDNQRRLRDARLQPRRDARMMREMQLYNYDNDPAAGGGY